MKRILSLLQFLPISIFIGVARSHGFLNDAWPLAFQWGALAAALELAVLLPLLGSRLSRLIAGANAFLIAGGVAFFFNISWLLQLIGFLRESAAIFFVGIVCVISTLVTPNGVFEDGPFKCKQEKKFSVYFLVGTAVAFSWSFLHRGNTTLGGVAPFVALILLKQVLRRRMMAN